MRVQVLKNIRDSYFPILRIILKFEDEYGAYSYYSKRSSNGIAWKVEDLAKYGIKKSHIKYLFSKGILERIAPGVYHIRPSIKDQLRKELEFVEVNVSSDVDVEKAIKYVIKNPVDAKAIYDLVKFQKKWDTIYDDIGWSAAKGREIIINSGSSPSLFQRLKEAGLIKQIADDEYRIALISPEILSPFIEYEFSTDDALYEYRNVVLKLRKEYDEFVESLNEKVIDELSESIKNVLDLKKYTQHVMDTLYMDALLPLIQQYGMADVPIFSDKGKKVTQTGFSLAYFGEPGTGKTFATDDFLRGNEKNGVPPHGIIGRMRYAEGMTPKKFISILEAYRDFPADWVIPEFNDFFRYQGMVEKLKLVIEQREVSDETKRDTIKPYKVTSFFIVNYNTHLTKKGWKVTIRDPNFSAIEDRMVCRVFVNDETREKAIYENMVRKINGEIEWYLSGVLRKHLTATYHYLVKNNVSVVIDASDFVWFGDKIRALKVEYGTPLSNRVILKGIQIAGSAALVKALNVSERRIKITRDELLISFDFIKEEIKTRARKTKS